MNRILISVLLLLFPVFSFSQFVTGDKNVNGGEKYSYVYIACAPVKTSPLINCDVYVVNGKSNLRSLPMATGVSTFPFKVTWDNVQGKGSISVLNPECGTSIAFTTNITKQCTTTTVSENISNNRTITGCYIAVSNTDISNNATVAVSAERGITITPNTIIRNGTNVHFFISPASVYLAGEMDNEEADSRCIPCEAEPACEPGLSQNAPNPFSGQTVVSCYIPETGGNSRIVLFDAMGNRVNSIPLEGTGHHEIILDSTGLKPGIYTYSLMIGNRLVATKRMVVGR